MILLDIYSTGLWITYVLIGIAAIGMILGILLAIFQNLKKGGLVALVAFIGLFILFGIGYAVSTDVVPTLPIDMNKYTDAAEYKMSGAGLVVAYVLMAVAFVLMIFGMIKNIVTGN